jgi:hypothetical protein
MSWFHAKMSEKWIVATCEEMICWIHLAGKVDLVSIIPFISEAEVLHPQFPSFAS